MLTITVDVHEADSKVMDEIVKRNIGHVKMKHMESSDIRLDFMGKSVGFELKRQHDLDHSLHSGRLHNQICRMYDEFDCVYLIIEDWKMWGKGDLVKGHERHCKTVRSLNRKIATYESTGEGVTCDIIEDIAKALISGQLLHVKRPIIVLEGLSDELKVLCGLPGINETLGQRLIDKYTTPEFAMASLHTWVDDIEGIGDKKVQRIQEVWG